MLSNYICYFALQVKSVVIAAENDSLQWSAEALMLYCLKMIKILAFSPLSSFWKFCLISKKCDLKMLRGYYSCNWLSQKYCIRMRNKVLFLKKINQNSLSHKAVLPSLDFGPRSLTVVFWFFFFLLLLLSTNWHTGTILNSKLFTSMY